MLRADLPSVELFLEDIIEVFDIAQGFDTESVLQTDDYEFPDVQDLAKLGKESLPSLMIQDSIGSLRISINPMDVSIYVIGSDDRHYGILSRLRDFFASRQLFSSWVARFQFPLLMMGWSCWIGGLLFFWFFVLTERQLSMYSVSSLCVMFFSWLLLLACRYLAKPKMSRICLKKRSEYPTSWQRLDYWIDSKGAANKFVSNALYVAVGALVLYVLQNMGAWLRWLTRAW